LQQVTFETGSLTDGQLASITGTHVTFDETAAGYGWFVDRTPFDDSEFDVPVPNRELHTTELSPAFGRVDLLTAVMRGLGYVYMQGKGRVPRRLRPLVEEVLSPSMRRLPDSSSIQMTQPHTDVSPGPQAVSTGPVVSAKSPGSASGMGGTRLKSSGITPQSGETINQALGTLPAGKSITMMFQVTVNNPVPPGVIKVCNQGTVSGSNFSSVLTDDPSTVTANDPTCTTLCVPPVVTTAITNQTVAAGATATFTTTVQGSIPFTFVWKKNGVVLVSGTSLGGRATITTTTNSGNATSTSTLTITGTIASDADTYTVDPTDACSVAVPRETATLTVVSPPTISKAFTPTSIAVGATSQLSFTITNPNSSTTLTGVNFTDTLPVGLTVADSSTTPCSGTLTVTAAT